MTNPTSKNHLAAVVSFEDSVDKLRSCLEALRNWVPEVTVVIQEDEDSAKEIIEEFKMSVCIHSTSTTSARWEYGLTQINASWVLLVRSNEIITGQLRKSIAEKKLQNVIATGNKQEIDKEVKKFNQDRLMYRNKIIINSKLYKDYLIFPFFLISFLIFVADIF